LFGACIFKSAAVVVESGGTLFEASFDVYDIELVKCIGCASWWVAASFRVFRSRSGC
jgi:hypothetical protein